MVSGIVQGLFLFLLNLMVCIIDLARLIRQYLQNKGRFTFETM